jgi:hypothetical protein
MKRRVLNFQVVKARSSSSPKPKAAPPVPLEASLSVVKRADTSLQVPHRGHQHGVGHGDWRRVNGFSEKILDWIIASEQG